MKHFLLFLISILMLHTVTAQVDIDISGINVSLVNQEPDPVSPGDTLEVRFSVERLIGPNPIENVDFRLVPEFPFSLVEGDSGVRTINIIRPKIKDDEGITLRYRLKVSPDASEGLEDLVLEYSRGVYSARLEPFSVRIRSQDAALIVQSVQTIPDPIIPGKPFKAIIIAKNAADSVLKNIQFTIESEKTPFAPYKTSSERILRTLAADSVTEVVFDLIADGKTSSAMHSVPFTSRFEDETGQVFVRNVTLAFPVNEVPKYLLSIEESTALQPGSAGDVIVSLANIGTADMKFVVLRLVDSDGYEVITTPQVYVGNIEPDDFETADFKVYVSKQATYQVPLLARVEYRDNFNHEFSDDVSLAMKLYSREEIAKYKLQEVPSAVGGFVSFLLLVLVLVFVLFMVIDWSRNPMARYRKVLWFIVILTGVGAILYYYMARRRE